MILVPLAALPNQTLSIRLEDSLYDITLRFTNGVMSCSISRDNTTLMTNLRVVSGTPLLPYRYLEEGYGNFAFITENEEYPDYSKFGITQRLLYFTKEEVEIARAGT